MLFGILFSKKMTFFERGEPVNHAIKKPAGLINRFEITCVHFQIQGRIQDFGKEGAQHFVEK